jgi:hypothetical protein
MLRDPRAQGEIDSLDRLAGAAGSPEDRFIAEQLERVAQLLRFTGAETAAEFAARVECNELWTQDRQYDRGWRDGRASLIRETNHSPYLAN